MKAIYDRLYNANARMGKVIFLAGAISGDVLSDELDDFLTDDLDAVVAAFGEIPRRVENALDGIDREDRAAEFSDWLIGKGMLGFLVHFETPVMTYHKDDARSYSWGYYSVKWVYGDSIDEAINKGMEWVDEMRRKEKSKSKKGGAA